MGLPQVAKVGLLVALAWAKAVLVASGPFELVTTPPISSETILISAAGFPAVRPVRAIPRTPARAIAPIPTYDIFLFITADLLRRLGQGQGILNRRLGCATRA
jgi:hypothetical protein